MQIANRSRLRLVEGMNDHTIKDAKYRITANPVTTRRFGPSGSLKRKNNTLEHTRDVMPRISNEAFFDLKSMISFFSGCRTRLCLKSSDSRRPFCKSPWLEFLLAQN